MNTSAAAGRSTGRSAVDAPQVVALGAVAAYFAFLAYGMNTWAYQTWVVIVLVPVILAVGAVIILFATSTTGQEFRTILLVSLGLKIVGSFARYFVSAQVYGASDAVIYDLDGAARAASFRRGEIPLTELLSFRQGKEFVSDVTAVIYTAIGPTHLGATLVFGLLGFLGMLLFHRAALVGMPSADQRRYALLVLLLPSLLFWPSSVGKEAIMILALGMVALGVARICARKRTAWPWLAAGLGIIYMVRPHVGVVVLSALVVAMAFRPRGRAGLAPFVVRRLVMVGLLIVALAFVLGRTIDRFVPVDEGIGVSQGVDALLDRATYGTNPDDAPVETRLDNSLRPTSPLHYPSAAFSVLFRPLIIESRSLGDLIAAVETTLVLILAVQSRHRLKRLPVLLFREPYLMFAVTYTAVFALAWSSFANTGALVRQRVQVWPFVLLLLALPAVPTSPARARTPEVDAFGRRRQPAVPAPATPTSSR